MRDGETLMRLYRMRALKSVPQEDGESEKTENGIIQNMCVYTLMCMHIYKYIVYVYMCTLTECECIYVHVCACVCVH